MKEIEISHDGTLDIATGRSRKETSWKNKQWLWSDLVKKLSKTHRTAETHADYLKAKKPRQDEIKDIGGFVGGYLGTGRRKAGSVVHRQLITLDADFASKDFWDDFTLLYGCAAVIYSTHKHSTESPRLRLIIPLDREVDCDEYQAISRWVASVIGIDQFDHTTYQPERLMYWPSTSSDGEYVFNYQDGPWLSADEILANYHNWKDTSEWPTGSQEDVVVRDKIKEQEDPLEKKGLIGAFCRTYSIHEVIEKFLDDVYEACDVPNRYTYKEGSTSAGLITYDDKFAYSHHGTDPTSGKLCNAFDLVRIHKYGLQDNKVKSDAAVTELPSYNAMMDLAASDGQVCHNQALEDFAQASEDTGEDVELQDTDWLKKLKRNKKGIPEKTIDNALLILRNDPKLKSKLSYDLFSHREVLTGGLPWRKDDSRFMEDSDDAAIRHYLEKYYKFTSKACIDDALQMIIKENSFHPVREYLSGLKWDKKPRLDTIFIDYMGANDNAYTRAVTRKMIVAAVARVHRQKVKFDHMLILVGRQGIGKSTIIKKLGREWFSDSFNFHMLKSKQAEEQVQGVLLMEVGELTGMKKADMEAAKAFISREEDRFRVAYGKRVGYFPRQCVFFGSTNDDTPLNDPTGNRRFWPVTTDPAKATKDVFTQFTDTEIDQVWAEAKWLFDKGEPLYLSKEIEQLALQIQTEHTEKDDKAGVIETFLDIEIPANWHDLNLGDKRSFLNGTSFIDDQSDVKMVQRDRVCVAEIWCEMYGRAPGDMNRFNTKDIHIILKSLPNWQAVGQQRFGEYGRQLGYKRVSQEGVTRPDFVTSNLSHVTTDDDIM